MTLAVVTDVRSSVWLFSLVMLVLRACSHPGHARAEGSAQVGVAQRLVTDSVLRVDVYEVGEVIHIAARNSEPAPLSVRVYAPSGSETLLPIVNGRGALASETLPPSICDALRVTAQEVGIYRVRFEAEGTTPLWQRTVSPFDVSVTDATQECVTPATGAGRLHSLDFHLRAAGFDRNEATNADFFVMATNLARTTSTVWLLDFEGLAGWDYHVVANGSGLGAPYAYTSVPTALVPTPGAAPEYPIYLAPPARVAPPPPEPVLGVTPFTGVHTGIAGVGVELEFTSNVLGTFQLLVDVNRDGRYEPTQGDASFNGVASVGVNRFSWSGAFADGSSIAPSAQAYSARLSLRTGEFHFAGFDIETARPGLAVFHYDVLARRADPTWMQWDDRRVVSGDPTRDSNPTFALTPGVASNQGRHGWGDYTARAPGDGAYIDTWVFRAEASIDVALPWLRGTDDADDDLLDNARERELGTRHDLADTDGDGIPDGREAPSTGPAPDTNRNGIIDALDPEATPQPPAPTPAPSPILQPNGADSGTAPSDSPSGAVAPTPQPALDATTAPAAPVIPAPPAAADSTSATGPSSDLDAGTPFEHDAGAVPVPVTRHGIVGGAACSVVTVRKLPGGTGAWLLLGAYACTRVRRACRRQRQRDVRWLLAALALLPQSTRAQDAVRVDAYRPAETAHDGFVARRASLPKLAQGTRLDVAYAWRPLVVEAWDESGRREPIALIRAELGVTAQQSFALFDRMLLSASLHGVALQQGTAAAGLAASAGLGDLKLSARVAAWERGHRGPLQLALHAGVVLPVARWSDASQQLRGEAALSGESSALVELALGDVIVLGSFGVRLRPRAQLGPLSVHHELPYAAAVLVPIGRVISLHAEVYGARALATSARGSAPCEALAGARATLGSWTLGAAAGPGLSSGYGSPDGRVLLQLAHGMGPEFPEPRRADSDGDSVPDDRDRCSVTPEDMDGYEDHDGCPDFDDDKDGVPDLKDGAPRTPEDPDAFEDNDGVPEPDNDRDQIPDATDLAPNQAEDRDGFEDDDGVPDLDNDADGIRDLDDGAPNDPEDRDRFADNDGVPDLDNDLDGVLDAFDACPLAPGAETDRGCPRLIQYAEGQPQIVLMARVEFATDRDVILAQSAPILEEVRAALVANAQLTRVRVEGHTDATRGDTYNLDLSRRRAANVRAWLIEHGIAAERLEAYGCGLRRPIDDNQTGDGRQRNRRVEFHIVEPAPAYGARSAAGCLATE